MHETLWSSRCLQKRKSKTLLQISQHIKIYTRQLGIGSPNNSRDRGMVMNNRDISKRKREGKPSRKCRKTQTCIYKISGSFSSFPLLLFYPFLFEPFPVHTLILSFFGQKKLISHIMSIASPRITTCNLDLSLKMNK